MDAASVHQAREWLQRLSAACSICNPAEELLSPMKEPALTVRDRPEALRFRRGLQQAQSLMLHVQVMIVNQARILAVKARRPAPQHPLELVISSVTSKWSAGFSGSWPHWRSSRSGLLQLLHVSVLQVRRGRLAQVSCLSMEGKCVKHAAEPSAACSNVRWLPSWQQAQQTVPGSKLSPCCPWLSIRQHC